MTCDVTQGMIEEEKKRERPTAATSTSSTRIAGKQGNVHFLQNAGGGDDKEMRAAH